MPDGIRRWITGDNAFRILVACSTETVRRAVEVAGTVPEVSDCYGRLLTGTALFQLAQTPIDRVQCTLHHSGTAGMLLADVRPGPIVRGRVEQPRPTSGPAVSGSGTVELSRLNPRKGGELYQSFVPVHHGSVADALQQYALESEQILTFFSLVTVLSDDGQVARAAGLVVQALPEMRHEHLERLTRCLERARFDHLVMAGDDPFDAAEAMFHELAIQPIGRDPLEYRCTCSKEVAVGAVLTLSPEEIESIRAGGEETVTCEFCATSYVVTAGDLS